MDKVALRFFGYFLSDKQPGYQFTVNDVKDYIMDMSAKHAPSNLEVARMIATTTRVKRITPTGWRALSVYEVVA